MSSTMGAGQVNGSTWKGSSSIVCHYKSRLSIERFYCCFNNYYYVTSES